MKRIFFIVPVIGILAACDAPSGGQILAGETCHAISPLAMLPLDLDESSGVVFSGTNAGILWSHNDSGGEPELFGLDMNGGLAGKVRVSGAVNRDWEDIARGPCPEGSCLFIGDVGDNAAQRNDVAIYVVPEPRVGDGATMPARRYPIRYPDGPRDVEALFVMADGALFVISKGGDSPIGLYRYPLPMVEGDRVELELVRTLSTGAVPLADRVTGADTGNGWVVVRTYTELLAYPAADFIGGQPVEPIRIDLTPLAEGQGEGVAIGPDEMIALTGEGFADQVPGTFALLRCPFLADSRKPADR